MQNKLNKDMHLTRKMRAVTSAKAYTIWGFSNIQVMSPRPNDLCIARG
jgi:hypothetical protein